MKKEEIKQFYFIFLIILIKFALTDDCSTVPNCYKCDKNICEICEYNYTLGEKTHKCYYGCGYNNTYIYYRIHYDEEYCEPLPDLEMCDTTKYYLVQGTHECINQCPDNYPIFNRICRKYDCPDNSEINPNNVTLECICKYFYYINKEDGKNEIICLSENDRCPTKYPYYIGSSNYCMDESEAETACSGLLKRKMVIDGAVNYQCIENCTESEIISNGFCQIRCPEGEYQNLTSGMCDKCENNFVYEKDKTCHEKCPNLNVRDSGSNRLECVDYNSCIDLSFPFYYEKTKSCIKSCIDTENTTLFKDDGALTAEYFGKSKLTEEGRNVLMCVPDCKTMINASYLQILPDNRRKCVNYCEKFNYNYTCYDKCSDVGVRYYIFETKECVDNCSYGYYLDKENNTCYKNCSHSADKKFHYENSLECVSCDYKKPTISTDPPLNPSLQDYYIPGDHTFTCYKSKCPLKAPYFNKGTNECFKSTEGCVETVYQDIRHIYHDEENPYECLEKCEDVEDKGWKGYRTEDFICLNEDKCPPSYPFEYQKICYKNGCPDENMIYSINFVNNTKKCYFRKDCLADGNKYIQGDMCVPSCEIYKYPFVIEPEDDKPGICYKTIEGCYNLSYYYTFDNKTFKTCVKDCENGLYAYENKTKTTHPLERYGGTCLAQCEEDFPFIADHYCYKKCPKSLPVYKRNPNSINQTCLENCLNDYVFNGTECVEDCTNTEHKYNITEEIDGKTYKKCLEKCPKGYYAKGYECVPECDPDHYYDPINFTCSIEKSCKEFVNINYTFTPARKASDNSHSPLACLNECPFDNYYFDEEKLCREDCGESFYSSSDRQKCVKACLPGEVIETYNNKNKKCRKKCPSYFYRKQELNGEMIVVCVSKCKDVGPDYFYSQNSDGECVKKCVTPEIYSADGECYKECPIWKKFFRSNTEGFYDCLSRCEDSEYYIEGVYECINKCPETKNFTLKGNHVCLSQCPVDYPFYTEDEEHKVYFCSRSCPDNFASFDNKCVRYCNYYNNSYLPFLDPQTKTCVNQCPEERKYFQQIKETYNGEEYIYYKCLRVCDNAKYVKPEPSFECTDSCPGNYSFIGSGRRCKAYCDPIKDGKFYTFAFNSTNPVVTHYKCNDSCIGYYYYGKLETKECFIGSCPTKYYESPLGICYELCVDDPYYKYSTTDEKGKKVCSFFCKKPDMYYNEDLVCQDSCVKTIANITDENNKCVIHCDFNSTYKFENEGKCDLTCPPEKKYNLMDYKCVDTCVAPLNFVRPGGICSGSCDEKYQFAVKNDTSGEYHCEFSCPRNEYYYSDLKICQKQCNDGDFALEGTNICVNNCTAYNKYFYYPLSSPNEIPTFPTNTCVINCYGTDQKFTLQNNTCATSCQPYTNHFYRESDYKCLNKCPEQFSKTNGSICINECPISTEFKFLNEKKQCVQTCENSKYGYIYYISSEYVCLDNCTEEYFYYYNNSLTDHQCVRECPEDYPYLNGQYCVAECPFEKKYFVQLFQHNETNLQKKCFVDCPPEYRFLNVTIKNGKEFYECMGYCPEEQPYFIRSNDNYVTALNCTANCEGEKRFISSTKECVSMCQDGSKKFYINETQNVKCYDQCPDEYPYHLKGSYICIKECDGFINYDNKTCFERCQPWQVWGIDKSGKKYCLEECNSEFGFFTTPDLQCVRECDQTKYYTADFKQHTCDCKHLYTINETYGYKECLEPNIYDCYFNEKYKYRREGTFECVQYCKTVLSPDNVCLKNPNACPENTIKTDLPDGTDKCLCKYNYYLGELDKLICLGREEPCPKNRSFLVTASKECVYDCSKEPYNKQYLKTCLKDCPYGTVADGNNICQIKNNWYRDGKGEVHILLNGTNCTDLYPFLINETRECVKKCIGSDYFILFGNQCRSTCQGADNAIDMIRIIDKSLLDYSLYTCQCKNMWYFDKNLDIGIVCTGGNQYQLTYDNCSQIPGHNFYYKIRKTLQCVSECPEEFPYSFNDECFADCKEADTFYKYNFKQNNDTHKCECPYIFKKQSINGDNSLYKIKCEFKGYCEEDEFGPYVLINSTGECYPGTKCPVNKNFNLINGVCYKKESCPPNSHHDEFYSDNCVCNNLWYKEKSKYYPDEEVIHCMDRSVSECPFPLFIYQVNNTKECTNECPYNNITNTPYIPFNYKCYATCPPNTTNSTDGLECICNKEDGNWFQEFNERINYTCGLKGCPGEKEFVVNGTLECVNSCEERKFYKYNKMCFEFGCPYKTMLKTGSRFECEYRNLDFAKNLTDLFRTVEEDILNLSSSITSGGYTYDRFNTTLHIYPVNINGLNNEELITRNNLSLVNISKCIKEVYSANNMTNDTNILIAKYDIYNGTQDYLINPVEYQFYSSFTGKKLDLSVCKDNSIIVSYPITYKLDNYNLFFNETYANKIKKIFDIGKVLKQNDDRVDLFDYNSSVYQDICVPCEVNGKDVIMEDRRTELFPNVTVCESNCSFYYTDYEKERVYCKCQQKNEFDFNRIHYPINNSFNGEETKSLQKAPTNLPTLKCINNFRNDTKRTVTNNIAFYYSTVVFAGEIGLFFASIFFGYKKMTSKIGKKLEPSKKKKNMRQDDEDSNSDNTENTNKNNNIDNIAGSQRELSSSQANPPKKEHVLDSEENGLESEKDKRSGSDSGGFNMRKNNENEDGPEKEVITVKKTSPNKIGSSSAYNSGQDGYDVVQMTRRNQGNNDDTLNPDEENIGVFRTNGSLIKEIKEEAKILTTSYEYALKNDKANPFVKILAEIFDKIYFSRTFFLYKKYDIFAMLVSLYLLYHLLVLTLSALFFSIKIISKIYHSIDFPNLGHYLLYGLITMVITWIIYGILLYLIRHDKKIEALIRYKEETEKNNKYDEEEINKKTEKLKTTIICCLIAFFIIEFVLVLFCFLYIIIFCGVYTGTKKLVFYSYCITLVEMIIIKIFYGLVLGILRHVSLAYKIKGLYKGVRFFDTHFS